MTSSAYFTAFFRLGGYVKSNVFLQAKVVTALIDFTPLWETMRRKQVTQYQLLKNGLDNKTLDTLKKNRNITLSTLEKLCQMLDCTPNDVVQFIPDDKK